jgi:iron(III) transport system substrate-binding protein
MAAVTALKDKYGYEYFDALGKQGVKIESGSVALTKLETGECKVIMILEESILKKREEDKSKLEVIYPTDGTIVVPSTIMTVNDQWNANKNTKTAEIITDWFLGPDGQSAIVKAWMHSPRKNPKAPFDAIPTAQVRANSMPVNWENVFRQREEIRTKFEEFVSKRK